MCKDMIVALKSREIIKFEVARLESNIGQVDCLYLMVKNGTKGEVIALFGLTKGLLFDAAKIRSDAFGKISGLC